MKLHIKIKDIYYSSILIGGNYKKTKCIIRWINPITENIQRSVGVSICNPNDEFNIIKGRRIAESRAKINMWRTYNRNIYMILRFSVKRHVKFMIHEEKHLRNLINDVKTN